MGREWTIKSSEVSQPASYRGSPTLYATQKSEFLLVPEEPGVSVDPVWGLVMPRRAATAFTLQETEQKYVTSVIAQGRGLAVVCTGLQGHWKMIYGLKVE